MTNYCTCGLELGPPEQAPGCYCASLVTWVCPQFGLDEGSHIAILKGMADKITINGDWFFEEEDA